MDNRQYGFTKYLKLEFTWGVVGACFWLVLWSAFNQKIIMLPSFSVSISIALVSGCIVLFACLGADETSLLADK